MVRAYTPCPARFEPEDTTNGTHTCCLKPGHTGERHLCPVCGTNWTDPEPVLFISPQVAKRIERLIRRRIDPSDRLYVTRQANKNDAAALD